MRLVREFVRNSISRVAIQLAKRFTCPQRGKPRCPDCERAGTLDFLGMPRISGGRIDIGALESQ